MLVFSTVKYKSLKYWIVIYKVADSTAYLKQKLHCLGDNSLV
jgi:hypothetical protein